MNPSEPSNNTPTPPSQGYQAGLNQPNNPNPYQSPSNPNPSPFPQQQQPPFQAPKPTDGFAITSMVLGILAIITCFFGIILGPMAVIFGHLSLGKIKRDINLGGKGMAIAGLVTGYVALVFSIFLIVSSYLSPNSSADFSASFFEEFEKELEKEMEKERQKNEDSDTRELIPDQQ